MIPRWVLVAVALGVVAGIACGGDGGRSGGDGGLRVVATTAVLGSLVEEVAGDRVSLTVLIPAGSDPHDFDLRSSQRRALEEADLVIRNGLGLDDFLGAAVDAGDARVVTATDGVRVREVDGEPDPHAWLDADNARVMVTTIADALAEADPVNADSYRAAAAAAAVRLDDADSEARTLLGAIAAGDRVVVTNHDSLGYFLERYGIRSIGSVIPGLSTAAEPSARDIAELIDAIRDEGVRAILSEGSVNPRIARQVAADTGVPIVDDLSGDTPGEAGSGSETVAGMIRHNAVRVAEALSGG